MIEAELYVNGKYEESADKKTINVTNPSNGRIVGSIQIADKAQITSSVDAAANAFKVWKNMSVGERCSLLHKTADILDKQVVDIARVMTMEQGKPLTEATGEVRKGIEILRYYAEEGKRVYGRLISGYDGKTTSAVSYEPVGVVAAITPWNYPIELIAWKLGGALAAGCTVCLKPPSETPLSPSLFIKAFHDAGLPSGVINLVFGRGRDIGPALLSDKRVKKIAFTGSTEVGVRIIDQCAKDLKKVSLELGGSCPLIVSSKANLKEAVKGAVRRSFRNMGQICIAINRIFVQKEIYHEFLDEFVKQTKQLVIADGIENPDADLGPLASMSVMEKIEEHIKDALAKGAEMLCGGSKPEGGKYEKGLFYLPTILVNTTQDMLIMSEETFGPAVGIMPFDTAEEAIELANSTPYGLASYVYTNDLDEADIYSRELESGNVAINNPDAGVINAPYGGFKESGNGYEHGPEGLFEYLRAKHIRTRYLNR